MVSSNSIAPSTLGGYLSAPNKWEQFLRSKLSTPSTSVPTVSSTVANFTSSHSNSTVDLFLTSENRDTKIKLLSLFIIELNDLKHSFVKEIQSLRFLFLINSKAIDIFEDPSLLAVRHGLKLTPAQLSKIHSDNLKFPGTWQMLDIIRENFLIRNNKHLVGSLVYLTCVLTYVFALRISECAHANPPKKKSDGTFEAEDYHALRHKDVIFFFNSPSSSNLTALESTFIHAAHISQPSIFNVVSVREIQFRFRTSKTSNDGSVRLEKLMVGDNSRENQLIKDIFTFSRDCCSNIPDPGHLTYKSIVHTDLPFISNIFLSRLDNKKLRRANSEDCSSGWRFAASTLGLDPKRFSSKSGKIGSITALKIAGISDEVNADESHHSSTSSNQQYQREGVRHPMCLSLVASLSTFDMQSMSTALISSTTQIKPNPRKRKT